MVGDALVKQPAQAGKHGVGVPGLQIAQLGLCFVPMVQPVVRERKLPMSQLLLERGEAHSFFCNRREKRHGWALP